MMGVPGDQTEESIRWAMEEFNKIAPAPPNVVALDQDSASISAARKVWPESYHLLDDWHLNANQLKDVASFLIKNCSQKLFDRILSGDVMLSRRKTRSYENDSTLHQYMISDLHSLRASYTETVFLKRRDAFEKIYFGGISIQDYPRWYISLYHKL